ncbi:hypothetical protein BV20DRAFT_968080 [Pilatotrama ljubarskyi]|nr:hypothetical protein BV20DRAFT_968080 [Pilatotrama ljubarskyi]
MKTFTDALLAASPAIPGLDATVVIPPRRMHFTLGVMSLDLDEDAPATADVSQAPTQAGQEKPRPTLEAAKQVLQELKPKIAEILGQEPLRVKLDRMDIMKPERRDDERAHVMWLGPAVDGESAKRLKRVAGESVKPSIRVLC